MKVLEIITYILIILLGYTMELISFIVFYKEKNKNIIKLTCFNINLIIGFSVAYLGWYLLNSLMYNK